MNYQKLQDKYIAHGCTTFSKRADQYASNHPTHVVESSGAKILGSDNKWYIDLVCGLGSNLINIQNNYCKTSIYEPLLAAEIVKRIKFVEKMKFVKTGSAACEAAVRYARAYTGKKTVVGTGYHGCHNWAIAAEKPGLGCVSEGYVKHNSLTDLIAFIRNSFKLDSNCDIGGCIVEPVQLDASENVKNQLIELRDLCTKHKIVLIFDEIITGFRVPRWCFSQFFGVIPDLILFGKALGNGFPLAVVAGKKEIMDLNGVFISNTHNGEESSLKSALATLQNVNNYQLRTLWRKGGQFKMIVNKMLPKDKLQLVGYNTRGEWQGDEEFRTLFFERMAYKGVILGRAWFVTLAHNTKILHEVLDAVEASLKEIKKGVVRTGSIPKPVFQRNP